MSKRRNNLYDVIPSMKRQLNADVVTWIECDEGKSELVIGHKDFCIGFSYVVARYKPGFDAFVQVNAFETMTEAWMFFVATAEVDCIRLNTKR